MDIALPAFLLVIALLPGFFVRLIMTWITLPMA